MEIQGTEQWGKRFRILTFALLFSGALNVALVGAWWVPTFVSKTVPSSETFLSSHGGAELVRVGLEMWPLTFRELVAGLTNQSPVEEGLLRRDLALGVLTTRHNFDLARALPGKQQAVRTLLLTREETISLCPGLSDEMFQAVVRFAYEEKWPLTPKGLFSELQKRGRPYEESLVQAVSTTPEWYALQNLFAASGTPQPPASLIDLIFEGKWESFASLTQQGETPLAHAAQREALLLALFRGGSSTAARLLLECDFAFAFKNLSDDETLQLLTLLDTSIPIRERYVEALSHSLRSDRVLAQVRSCVASREAPTPSILAVPRTHVVQEGENLWRIARRYQVKVDQLIALNELGKEQIFPGMILKLPEKIAKPAD